MPIQIDLSDKRALVTGAGAGIGREIARWLARAGAKVAILDVRPEPARDTAAQIEAEGGQAEAFVVDARDDAQLTATINQAADSLGGLDIAINNVGMMGPQGSAGWLDMTPEMFRDVVEQNLVVTAVACMAQARLMQSAGGATPGGVTPGGVICNVTSGETTRPSPNMAGYGAAKAAINHLTGTLAVELGPLGIRVHAIAPGTTLTETVRQAFSEEHYRALVEATPLRQETQADELGRLVVFLASDLARNITGQLILADAGAHLSRTRPGNVDPGGAGAGAGGGG